jgi:hypothetical protein
MPKNAREVYSRKAMKSKGGELGKDSGKRKVPGFLGRSSVGTVPARTGYTEGMGSRLGPGGKGRSINLPTKSSG